MWLATNKRSGASQRMTDHEKAYWESTSYGRIWNFVEIKPPARVSSPLGIEPMEKQKTKKAKKTAGRKATRQ